jgi:hypothetical protein
MNNMEDCLYYRTNHSNKLVEVGFLCGLFLDHGQQRSAEGFLKTSFSTLRQGLIFLEDYLFYGVIRYIPGGTRK